MLNPEAPRLLGVYRRTVPAAARRIIAAPRVDPDLRRQMKMRLATATAAADRARTARAGRRHQAMVDRPDRRILTVGRETKVALVMPGVTPLTARRANLESVLKALSGAELDHFCVRGRSNTAAAVAVREDDRRAVLAALAESCADEPGYVTLVEGNGTGPRSRCPDTNRRSGGGPRGPASYG